MTFRDKLADLISGGKLTRARTDAEFWCGAWCKEMDLATKSLDRLSRIIAMETPKCAHIGKRMARVARGIDE